MNVCPIPKNICHEGENDASGSINTKSFITQKTPLGFSELCGGPRLSS